MPSVVAASSSSKRAIADFYGGDFDLVILCHSLFLEDHQRLAESIYRRSPGAPVVCVEGFRPLGASPPLPAVEGEPQKLLAGLSKLIAQYPLGGGVLGDQILSRSTAFVCFTEISLPTRRRPTKTAANPQ